MGRELTKGGNFMVFYRPEMVSLQRLTSTTDLILLLSANVLVGFEIRRAEAVMVPIVKR